MRYSCWSPDRYHVVTTDIYGEACLYAVLGYLMLDYGILEVKS